MVYSRLRRSINAKKQLRDRKGRWIEMGAKVKWFLNGEWHSGRVDGSQGDYVVADDGNGGKKKVHRTAVEVVESKATLGGKRPEQAKGQTTQTQTPTPAQPKATTNQPAAQTTAKPQKDAPESGLEDASNWEKIGEQRGSNQGGVFKDDDGDEQYLKFGSEDKLKTEILAHRLYDRAGIATPSPEMVEHNNVKAMSSPMVPGEGRSLADVGDDPDFKKRLQQGLAVDAWLGNQSVAGPDRDKVLEDINGDPIRIDTGGALTYNNDGTRKGDFGDRVNELDTFQSSEEGQALYGDMTREEMQESAQRLADISDEDIDEIVDSVDLDADSSAQLKDILKARRDDVLARLGEQTQDDAVDEMPVDPEKVKRIEDLLKDEYTELYDEEGDRYVLDTETGLWDHADAEGNIFPDGAEMTNEELSNYATGRITTVDPNAEEDNGDEDTDADYDVDDLDGPETPEDDDTVVGDEEDAPEPVEEPTAAQPEPEPEALTEVTNDEGEVFRVGEYVHKLSGTLEVRQRGVISAITMTEDGNPRIKFLDEISGKEKNLPLFSFHPGRDPKPVEVDQPELKNFDANTFELKGEDISDLPYDTDKQAEAWAETNLETPPGVLTSQEGETVKQYANFMGYGVNEELRTDSLDQHAADVETMDSAISKGKRSPNDIFVVRATSAESLGVSEKELAENFKRVEGTTVTDKGYYSSTLGETPVSQDSMSVQIHTRVPAGHEMLYVPGAGGSSMPHEREVILPRGTKLHISSITQAYGDDGNFSHYDVQAEVVPADWNPPTKGDVDAPSTDAANDVDPSEGRLDTTSVDTVREGLDSLAPGSTIIPQETSPNSDTDYTKTGDNSWEVKDSYSNGESEIRESTTDEVAQSLVGEQGVQVFDPAPQTTATPASSEYDGGATGAPDSSNDQGEVNGSNAGTEGTDREVPGNDGGEPDSGGDGNDSGTRTLARVVAPLPAHGREAEIAEAGGSTPTINEIDPQDASVFRDAISRLADTKHGAAVYVYDEDEYKDMRLFMNESQTAGFALKGDEIVSVFSTPDNPDKRVARHLLAQAVANGGTRLDAFDTVLPKIYASEGFKPVARVKWDDEYAPDGWDYNTFNDFNGGRPDVVFMSYDPQRINSSYDKSEGSYVDSYDDGVAAAQAGGTPETSGREYPTIDTSSAESTRAGLDALSPGARVVPEDSDPANSTDYTKIGVDTWEARTDFYNGETGISEVTTDEVARQVGQFPSADVYEPEPEPWEDREVSLDDFGKTIDVMGTSLDPKSEKIQALARDIKKNGITTPIQVETSRNDGSLFTTDGHHRILAAREAGLETVPVRVFSATDKGRSAATRNLVEIDKNRDNWVENAPAAEVETPTITNSLTNETFEVGDEVHRASGSGEVMYAGKIVSARTDENGRVKVTIEKSDTGEDLEVIPVFNKGLTPAAPETPEAPEATSVDEPEVSNTHPLDAFPDLVRRTPEMLEGESYPPTQQQQDVIDAVLGGLNTKVQAKAGTGKTATLVALAKRIQVEEPESQITYIVFNKANQVEATERMPGNVEPRTMHSLAFTSTPAWMKKRVEEKHKALNKPTAIANHFNVNNQNSAGLSRSEMVRAAQNAVVKYAQSGEDNVQASHVIHPGEKEGGEYTSEQINAITDLASRMWSDKNSPDGVLAVQHDDYRKRWALTGPDLSDGKAGNKAANKVFLDEAQDIPPVVAKVIADQNIQKVIVGDADQAINGFAGGTDYLSIAESDTELPLNQSWRFGKNVADIGNRFLQLLDSKTRVVGGGKDDGDIEYEMELPDAILTRTNAGLLAEVANQQDLGRRVGVPTGTKADLMSLTNSVAHLRDGMPAPQVMHADVLPFESWDDLLAQASGKIPDPIASKISKIFGESNIDDIRASIKELVEGDGEGLANVNIQQDDNKLVLSGKGTWAMNVEVTAARLGISFNEAKSTKGQGMSKMGFYFKDGGWNASGKTPEARQKQLDGIYELLGVNTEPPEVTISTAHKSKGLEWDRVKISDDFRTPKFDEGSELPTEFPDDDEHRLAYVAVTRARKALDPGSLSYVFDYTEKDGGTPSTEDRNVNTPEVDTADVDVPENNEGETDFTDLDSIREALNNAKRELDEREDHTSGDVDSEDALDSELASEEPPADAEEDQSGASISDVSAGGVVETDEGRFEKTDNNTWVDEETGAPADVTEDDLADGTVVDAGPGLSRTELDDAGAGASVSFTKDGKTSAFVKGQDGKWREFEGDELVVNSEILTWLANRSDDSHLSPAFTDDDDDWWPASPSADELVEPDAPAIDEAPEAPETLVEPDAPATPEVAEPQQTGNFDTSSVISTVQALNGMTKDDEVVYEASPTKSIVFRKNFDGTFTKYEVNGNYEEPVDEDVNIDSAAYELYQNRDKPMWLDEVSDYVPAPATVQAVENATSEPKSLADWELELLNAMDNPVTVQNKVLEPAEGGLTDAEGNWYSKGEVLSTGGGEATPDAVQETTYLPKDKIASNELDALPEGSFIDAEWPDYVFMRFEKGADGTWKNQKNITYTPAAFSDAEITIASVGGKEAEIEVPERGPFVFTDKSGKDVHVGDIVENAYGHTGKVQSISGGKTPKVSVVVESGQVKKWEPHVAVASNKAFNPTEDSTYGVKTDQFGNSYVNDSRGQGVYVGDVVTSGGKNGFTGPVTSINTDGQSVMVYNAALGKSQLRQTNKIVRESYPDPIEMLTPKQVTAVSDFKTRTRQFTDHLNGTGDGPSPAVADTIMELDNLIEKNTFSEPTTLFGGFAVDDIDEIADMLDGGYIHNKSFVSTSRDKKVSDDYIQGRDKQVRVHIQYDLPEGYHGYDTDYDIPGMEQFAFEKEVLLGRNMVFSIQNNITKDLVMNDDGSMDVNLRVTGAVMSPMDAITSDASKFRNVPAENPHPFEILDDAGIDGDGFHASGPWGTYGASGMLIRHKNESGEYEYLIVQNGELHVKENRGLWQLPGGALNGNENPYQGAAREMHEEIAVPKDLLSRMTHVQDHQFDNGKGWQYTNILAETPERFDAVVDVIETSDARWVTESDLRKMAENGEILPALAANLDGLLNTGGNDGGEGGPGSGGDGGPTSPDVPTTPGSEEDGQPGDSGEAAGFSARPAALELTEEDYNKTTTSFSQELQDRVKADFMAKRGAEIQASDKYWRYEESSINGLMKYSDHSTDIANKIKNVRSWENYEIPPEILKDMREQHKAAIAAYDVEQQQYSELFSSIRDYVAENPTDTSVEAVRAVDADIPNATKVSVADGPVDWDSAPMNTPSVKGILEGLASSKSVGARGKSAMIDSTAIKENNIRFTRHINANGEDMLLARFEMNMPDFIKATKTFGPDEKADHTSNHGNIGYMPDENGDMTVPIFGEDSFLNATDGASYFRDIGRVSVTMENQSNGYGDPESFSFNAPMRSSMVYMQLPMDATPEEFEEALRGLDIANARPTADADMKETIRRQIYDEFVGYTKEDGSFFEKHPTSVSVGVDSVLNKYGVTLDDFVPTQTAQGFTRYLIPEKMAKKLTEDADLNAISHTFKFKTQDSGYLDHEARGTNQKAIDDLTRRIAGGKGWMATGWRMDEGDNTKGQSAHSDLNSGGARYLFTSPQKGSKGPKPGATGWGYAGDADGTVVAVPQAAYKYLGNYANEEDNGSGKRIEGNTVSSTLENNQYVYELMMKYGLSTEDTWFVQVGRKTKNRIVNELLKKGILTVNGIPTADYFVAPGDTFPEMPKIGG